MLSLLVYTGLTVLLHAQKVDERTWENGQPRSHETLDKKGFKTGECTYWYENGQMRLHEFYERGRRAGKSEGWFEDGNPEFTRNYVVMQRNNGSIMGTEPVAVKDGAWIEYHGNGQRRKEEHYALGVLQGTVTTWYESGQVDESKTMEDKFENGPYEKYYENGQLCQKGVYERGEKNGEWRTWYDNGQLAFRETFVSDKHIDGPWRGSHINGADSLSGSYEHGRREGIWTALYPSGKMKSKTLYRFGMPSGEFVEFYPNGNKSREGAFGESTADVKRGREQGRWKEWHPNGELMRDIGYDDGRLVGPCTEYYENGQKRFETNYLPTAWMSKKDDMMDGMTREWHENGQLMSEGAFDKGMRDGLWKEWYASGNLRSQAVYDKTKVSGAITEFYEDGKESSRGFFEVAGRRKKRTGHWTVWYEGGERQSEGEYIDNKKVGRWQEWYANGNIRQDAFYDEGALQGTFKDYYENGKLRSEGQYKGKHTMKLQGSHIFLFAFVPGLIVEYEGEPNGVWKYYDDQGKLTRTETWYNGHKK